MNENSSVSSLGQYRALDVLLPFSLDAAHCRIWLRYTSEQNHMTWEYKLIEEFFIHVLSSEFLLLPSWRGFHVPSRKTTWPLNCWTLTSVFSLGDMCNWLCHMFFYMILYLLIFRVSAELVWTVGMTNSECFVVCSWNAPRLLQVNCPLGAIKVPESESKSEDKHHCLY